MYEPVVAVDADWPAVRLGAVLQRVVEVGQPELPLLSVSAQRGVTLRGEDWGDGLRAASENLSGYLVVRPGDIVVNKLAARDGAFGRSAHHGLTSPAYFVLRPVSGIDSRFIDFLLHSAPYISEIGRRSKWMPPAQFDISWDLLRSMQVRIPDAETQARVADFLDREIQRISETTTAAESLVELARERFAVQAVNEIRGTTEATSRVGLQWLGQVAEDRDVCRLGYRYEVQLGKMLNPDAASGDELRPYLRNVNVQWDRIDVEDVNEMSFDASDRARFSLRSGDLLVCEGGDVGRCAIWEEQLPECYYQKALHRLRPRSPSKDLPRYLYFVLRVASRQGLFVSDGNQNTIPHLTAEQLRAHRFPFPSREVQEQVAERLDSWKRGVSEVESLAIHQSELLEERRQALITAAVTGRIDVEAVA